MTGLAGYAPKRACERTLTRYRRGLLLSAVTSDRDAACPPALDGTVLDGTVLDGTVLDGTVLDGTGPGDAASPQAGGLRLMAVHAHPDDESSKGSATMARYVRAGVSVLVCTMTGGERGSILNKAMDRPEVQVNLPAIRRQEMDQARQILGVEQRFLGFTDSGLPEGDPLPPLPEGCFALTPLAQAAEPLIRAVREFRPHVILTYDENGGYPHPDHIKTHQVAMEAFEAAGDTGRYPGCGEPWQPLKVYYFLTFHRDRFTALHEEMTRRGLESPYAERMAEWDKRAAEAARAGGGDRAGRPRRRSYPVTTRIPCADYFPIRDQALLAHATQVDPNGSWFACPIEVQQAAWPTEDYYLARSVAGLAGPVVAGIAADGGTEPGAGDTAVVDTVEDDLFAGIRERVTL
jgi:mycothiol S-conjugate amidase